MNTIEEIHAIIAGLKEKHKKYRDTSNEFSAYKARKNWYNNAYMGQAIIKIEQMIAKLEQDFKDKNIDITKIGVEEDKTLKVLPF